MHLRVPVQLGLLLLTIFVALHSGVEAQELEPGFVRQFNGTSLDGWEGDERF